MIKNDLSSSLIKNVINVFLSGIELNELSYESFDVKYDDSKIESHKYYIGFFAETLVSDKKISFCFVDFNVKQSFTDYLVIMLINKQPYIIGIIDGSDIFIKYHDESPADVKLLTKLKICLDIEAALDFGWSFYESSDNEDYFLSILEKFLY
jgi:hypothetical protein